MILLGLDDASLAGAPPMMILGSVGSLRDPDAVIIDLAGYHFVFPGQLSRLGDVLEMNDSRARIVGISDAWAPFTCFPVMFTRYSLAVHPISGPDRRAGRVRRPTFRFKSSDPALFYGLIRP